MRSQGIKLAQMVQYWTGNPYGAGSSPAPAHFSIALLCGRRSACPARVCRSGKPLS